MKENDEEPLTIEEINKIRKNKQVIANLATLSGLLSQFK